MKKLTLSMDAKDIRAARRIADAHRTSISGLFSRLVRAMSVARPGRAKAGSSPDVVGGGHVGGDAEQLPPATRRLSGIIRAPRRTTDRELIEDAILERHGRADRRR